MHAIIHAPEGTDPNFIALWNLGIVLLIVGGIAYRIYRSRNAKKSAAQAPKKPVPPAQKTSDPLAQKNQSSATARPRQAAPSDDVTYQLRKLGELHTAGILTDQEFIAKKTELLARL